STLVDVPKHALGVETVAISEWRMAIARAALLKRKLRSSSENERKPISRKRSFPNGIGTHQALLLQPESDQPPYRHRRKSAQAVRVGNLEQDVGVVEQRAVGFRKRRAAIPDMGCFAPRPVELDDGEILTPLQPGERRKAHVEASEIELRNLASDRV